MSAPRKTHVCRAVFACLTVAALLPASAAAETVSSGPVKARVPTGNAQPQKVATDEQIRPRETLTPAQLAAARAIPSAGKSGSTLSAPAAPAAPATRGLSFEGTAQTQGLRPPDTHGAVGNTQFVEVTNSKFEVFNRNSGAVLKTVTLNSFCGYNTTTIFDPRVVYDKIWKRWVVVAEAFPETASGPQILCLAVSTSSNATGSFYTYLFDAPRGAAAAFYDYPMLGMDQDAVIVTANIFNPGYVGSNLFGVAKADLYNGRGFSVPVFNPAPFATLSPPIVETNDTAAVIMASPGGGSSIGIYRASNLGRSGATMSARTDIAVPAFAASPVADQSPPTSDKLDVLNRFQDHGTQISGHVLNTQTTGIGSFPAPRWWQLNTNTNALVATGNFFESATSHDFNPGIAGSPLGGTGPNPIGRMFYTWTSTEPSGAGAHNARVKASGRLATDPVNLVGGDQFGASAPAPYNPSGDTVERWGDYSSVSLDPVGVTGCGYGNRAYAVNERNISAASWGSRVGRVGFC